MKIKQLHLQNYGRFEDLTINFAPTDERASNVTVIVGNNGAGKSQILQALAISLSQFVSALGKNLVKNNGLEIDKKSILNGKNESEISVKINDFSTDISWKIYATKNGGVGLNSYEMSFYNHLTENYKQRLNNSYDSLTLPLIVLYPVERAILGNNEAIVSEADNSPLNGYLNAFEGASIQFSNFLIWFREQEDIENEMLRYAKNDTPKDIQFYEAQKITLKNLQNQYDRLKPVISELGEQLNSEPLLGLKNEWESLKIQIRELENYIESQAHLFEFANKIQDLAFSNRLGFKKLLAVREAIEEFTEFKNIRIQRQGTPTMIVEKDGEELDVNQLSQGEKSLLALVGDIARRLAILNPSLDDPLQGEGVVMIDEVDLHLHPKWQHNLIDKLVRTFHNVQFILTTHSPLIVSDSPNILVYSLENGNLHKMKNIYGEDANTLLNNIFDVPVRTPEVEDDFNNIRRAISNQEFEIADNLINSIAKKVASGNTELLKVKLLLAQAKLAQKSVKNLG